MSDQDPSDAGARAMTPDEEAALMLELLDTLERTDTRKAKKLRSSLVAVIADFRARRDRGEDLSTIKRETAKGLAALEVQAADMIARGVWTVHDRAAAESRRLGPESPEGRGLRTLADSLALYAEALEQLVDAGRLGDPVLRERALALVTRARDLLPAPPAGRT